MVTERLKLGIKGNPNFGLVRTLMVGVKTKVRTISKVRFGSMNCLADMDNQ
jgi:hypothetical protein